MSILYNEATIDELLEAFVDQRGLAEIAERLSAVCQEKADHIRTSYDDRVLSRAWVSAARAIRHLAQNAVILKVTP